MTYPVVVHLHHILMAPGQAYHPEMTRRLIFSELEWQAGRRCCKGRNWWTATPVIMNHLNNVKPPYPHWALQPPNTLHVAPCTADAPFVEDSAINLGLHHLLHLLHLALRATLVTLAIIFGWVSFCPRLTRHLGGEQNQWLKWLKSKKCSTLDDTKTSHRLQTSQANGTCSVKGGLAHQ